MLIMIVKIVTCPKCLNKTLLITATNSSVSKKCSHPDCDFKESMLLHDLKRKVE